MTKLIHVFVPYFTLISRWKVRQIGRCTHDKKFGFVSAILVTLDRGCQGSVPPETSSLCKILFAADRIKSGQHCRSYSRWLLHAMTLAHSVVDVQALITQCVSSTRWSRLGQLIPAPRQVVTVHRIHNIIISWQWTSHHLVVRPVCLYVYQVKHWKPLPVLLSVLLTVYLKKRECNFHVIVFLHSEMPILFLERPKVGNLKFCMLPEWSALAHPWYITQNGRGRGHAIEFLNFWNSFLFLFSISVSIWRVMCLVTMHMLTDRRTEFRLLRLRFA